MGSNADAKHVSGGERVQEAVRWHCHWVYLVSLLLSVLCALPMSYALVKNDVACTVVSCLFAHHSYMHVLYTVDNGMCACGNPDLQSQRSAESAFDRQSSQMTHLYVQRSLQAVAAELDSGYCETVVYFHLTSGLSAAD